MSIKNTIISAALAFTFASAAGAYQTPMPEGVKVFADVQQKAVSLVQNDKGHWEASFGESLVFIYIPAGSFMMGTNEGGPRESPLHSVELDGYWIAKFPTTVGQFRQFVEDTGYVSDAEKGAGAWQWTGEVMDSWWSKFTIGDIWAPMPDGRWNNIYFDQTEDHPVGSISWNDANAFCAWLSEKTGLHVVLPTEAQWEKAARGTGEPGEENRVFPWGNTLPGNDHANYADKNFAGKYGKYARSTDVSIDDGYVETSPVTAFPKGRSPYGVYDMAGNQGEWVYDIFSTDTYSQPDRKNPTGPARPEGVSDGEIDRVNRGGSWVDKPGMDEDGSLQYAGGHNIRSSARTGDEQNSSDDHMGFRVAIDGMRRAEVK